MGNLRCVAADRKPLGALQMKIFSHIASRRNRRTIVAVFEVTKEIPVYSFGPRRLVQSPQPPGGFCEIFPASPLRLPPFESDRFVISRLRRRFACAKFLPAEFAQRTHQARNLRAVRQHALRS